MSNLIKKDKLTEASLVENSERSISQKTMSVKQLAETIKKTVQVDSYDYIKKSSKFIKDSLDSKGIENRKKLNEANNIEADTKSKYSQMELDNAEYYHKVEMIRKAKLDNELIELELEAKRELIQYLKDNNLLFDIVNGQIKVIKKDFT